VYDVFDVESDECPWILIATLAGYFYPVIRHVLSFLFEDRLDVKRRTARDRNEQMLERSRRSFSFPVSVHEI
jgi:hypothetical protein